MTSTTKRLNLVAHSAGDRRVDTTTQTTVGADGYDEHALLALGDVKLFNMLLIIHGLHIARSVDCTHGALRGIKHEQWE